MYLIRLDDASEYMDSCKWEQMEHLLDNYNIKPIIGVIPQNEDPDLIDKYKYDQNFWLKVKEWEKKSWLIAMHGYQHKFVTKIGGINPVNEYSEFAGISLLQQCEKIKQAFNIFQEKGIKPRIFFAPAHTFDQNTITALKEETDIRILIDTIASNIYYKDGIYYIPQQMGHVRVSPFKITTFCYHPNNMTEDDFLQLEKFIKAHQKVIVSLNNIKMTQRSFNFYDLILKKTYFNIKKIKRVFR